MLKHRISVAAPNFSSASHCRTDISTDVQRTLSDSEGSTRPSSATLKSLVSSQPFTFTEAHASQIPSNVFGLEQKEFSSINMDMDSIRKIVLGPYR